MPSIDQIISKVRDIAAEDRLHVYKRSSSADGVNECLYMHGDRPGCIFGRALFDLGVDPTILTMFDNDSGSGISVVLDRLGTGADEDQSRWCRMVQNKQDIGYAWEHAVLVADRETPLP